MSTTGNSGTSLWAAVSDRWRAFTQGRREWCCPTLRAQARVSLRQERIVGWDQRRLSQATILIAGAGGIGGEIGEGAVQKGAGCVHFADFDSVSPTNLNRQKFSSRDLWRNKALCVAREMARRGFMGTRLVAHPVAIQDVDIKKVRPDVIVCAVDNQIPSTRLQVCRLARQHSIPAVFTGVTPDASGGYVFIQKPGNACWNCALKPELLPAAAAATCPESPASVDILKVLGGLALYVVDTVLMDRPRDWNFWYVSLSTSGLGGPVFVSPRSECPICTGKGA
ncbi:hypothetical protein PHYC_02039 [Phycisphaerales bacterium]|nr:hypothetical protein PHYC_02039 [Phycisphaerales bacterium]